MFKKKGEYYTDKRQEMLKFIPKTAKTILDVGCGTGVFSAQLLNGENNVWGIELDEESAQIASKVLNKVLTGKVEDVINELPDNYFDAIIFNDVLEHLYDPWDIMEKMKSKLSKDGNVVCSIPNVRYIRNIGQLVFNRDWKYCDFGILDVTHIRFFTKKSIIRFFTELGYKVEKIKGINSTKSERLRIYWFFINLFSFFSHTDIAYLQFAVVVRLNKD